MSTALRSALVASLLLLVAAPASAQSRWERKVRAFAAENRTLDAGTDHVVLFGSSSMEGFNSRRVREFLPTVGPRILNRGISGDGIGITVPGNRGLRNRIQASVVGAKPSHVFILNGRNSLGYGPDRVAAAYRSLVSELRAELPDAVLCVVTCAPVNHGHSHLKRKVVDLNAQLRTMAQEEGCELIDLHPRLVGGDGLMKTSLTSDGLHFNDRGYRILGQEIERVVAETEARGDEAAEGLPLPRSEDRPRLADRCATDDSELRLEGPEAEPEVGPSASSQWRPFWESLWANFLEGARRLAEEAARPNPLHRGMSDLIDRLRQR